MMLAGCDPSTKPEVQIPEIKDLQMNVSSRSIQLTATYSFPAMVTGCGAEMSGPQGTDTMPAQGSDEGVFSLRADGLQPDSDYRIRAFIDNGRQKRFSDWTPFHTAPLPAFSLKAEAGVFSATLHADIAAEGRKGFLFGFSEASLEPYPFADGTLQLRGLEPGHSYRYAAFIEIDGIPEVSEILSFDTQEPFADLQASVDGTLAAELSARPLYGEEITPESAGFYIGTDPSELRAIDAQTGKRWQASAAGLSPGRTYYYCAYVTAGGKEYRSPMMSFETGILPFGDKAFWDFLLGSYDADLDGQLSRGELDQVTNLLLFNLGIRSLSGIENLHHLKEIQMEEEALVRLDLSAMDDPAVESFVLRTPNLEELILPAVKSPETRYGGHFEVHSSALRGHFEFPDYAAGQVVIEAPLSSIGLDKIRSEGGTLMLTLTGTGIEELDLSGLAVSVTYANLCGNEKLKTLWLPYGAGSAMVVKDPHTQIKYK